MKLYLAHPFDSRTRIRKWELEFEKRSNIEFMNPFYDTKKSDIFLIDNKMKDHYDIDFREIIQQDIDLIKQSSGIVAVIDGNKSYGTIQEMVYAKTLGKPVYSLITNDEENHPWLKYHSTKIFIYQDNLEDFLIKLNMRDNYENKKI